ncbi:chromate transporter [Heyndrickxia oleronia]|uniref:chromate transporter n=1 Tax=Heyndrickxia oleronia TaxID=38875 RepID=UPI001F405E4C|nr:chromate transporter [Heyndrickxia oleronia]
MKIESWDWMKKNWSLLFQLFWVFFKIGPVTFGGGYAMIPLIEREVVKKRKWVEIEEVSDMFALSGTAPGAIAVNAATFIGHKIAGVRGAIAAMIGVLLPTFLIVMLLNIIFVSFEGNSHVKAAFLGIRAAVVALIAYAAIKIARTSILDKSTFILMIVMVIMMLEFHWHPIFVIVTGALLGIMIVKVKELMNIPVRLDHNQEKNKESIYDVPNEEMRT